MSIERTAGAVTVPVSWVKTITDAFEEALPSIIHDPFPALVRQINDELDCEMESIILDTKPQHQYTDDDQHSTQVCPMSDQNNDSNDSPLEPILNPTSSALSVGDPVEIFWQLDNALFHENVGAIHETNSHAIKSDHGDQQTLNLENEAWRYRRNHASTANFIDLPNSASEHIATLYTHY